jgi:DNA-binding NarL/FixJ family response regulator
VDCGQTSGVLLTAAETILIVDDDDGVRDLLATAMSEAGYATREAASGHEALEIVEGEVPSLVIVDVNLPGMSGYALCSILREQFGELLPIVFLSGMRTESYDRAGGILIGADDYLIKPFDPDEVVARVQRLLIRAAGPRPPVEERRLPFELTPREYEVLGLLMQGRTQGQIAKELFISPKTAATHIQHILGKLGVKSRAQAVALAAREHFFGSNSRPSAPPRSPSRR